MCGIAGYVGTRVIDPAARTACLGLMGRRGPDHAAERHWRTPAGRSVHLLHTRLSIIDLDARSNQPFQVGSRSIVTNGELYNYRELRRDLAGRGGPSRTESDTEVLLGAIGELGWEALDRCEGMWAFAVYDEATGRLTLSRDRFGEKPLYLYRDETGLYFGSETAFVFALLGRTGDIDVDHLHRYLVNGYAALYKSPATFFRGLHELPRASVLSIDDAGTEHLETYWWPAFDVDESLAYDGAVEAVREAVIRAVELRLRADVPLAFCMSGGVDSNSLISVARRVFDYDVHGFTIVMSDERYDESAMVQAAVAELGIRHTAVPLTTAGFLPKLRTLVRHHHAPVYTITYYTHWLLMAAIADHGYRISVSGTGADELFSGYYDHHLAYLAEVRQDDARYQAALSAWTAHVKPVIRDPYLRNPDLYVRDPGFRDHMYLDAAAFSDYTYRGWSEPFAEVRFRDGLLRNRMLNELFHEVVPPILHEDDLNAMYYSIENRSPFLDRPLFDLAVRIPVHHLIQGGFAKSVLRDAMQGIVPKQILESHRKVGFNAPIDALLDVRDPQVRSYLLDQGPIFDYVRRDRIERLIELGARDNAESKFLFYFLNSKMFLEEFGR